MKLTLLILLTFLGQLLSAQTFTEVPATPFEGVSVSSMAFSDVDGDGDQDVLITGQNDSRAKISKLYTNGGTGNFTEWVGTPFAGVAASSIAFSDVDGDGDPDVLITGANSSTQISKLYTNDGAGNFTEAVGTPFEDVGHSSIAFSDVDGDSDPDVLITGINGSSARISKLYTNDGAGNFTEAVGTPFEGVVGGSIAFSDVDGDGDPDVLITGETSSGPMSPISKLYTNGGVGNFTEAVGTPFEGVFSSSIAFSDVDGDGNQDVLITGHSGSATPISKLYTNDGAGNFAEVVGTPFEGVNGSSVAFSDVDGDGDPDVFITGRYSALAPFPRISKLFTNDGGGNFTEAAGTPFDGVEGGSIAFSDVDGDGDPDVLITGWNGSVSISKLYTNGLISSLEDITKGLRFDIMLYPNPSREDKINVSYTSEKNGLMTVKVFDLKGNLLSVHREPSGMGEQTFSIDITSLNKGSYFIQLDDGKRRGVRKFVVQ